MSGFEFLVSSLIRFNIASFGTRCLAWMLATSQNAAIRDGVKAIGFAQQAVAMTNRKDPPCLGTLAAAYAEAGQFEKAVAAEKEAMALLKTEEERNEYAPKLKLYEAKTPYRDKE